MQMTSRFVLLFVAIVSACATTPSREAVPLTSVQGMPFLTVEVSLDGTGPVKMIVDSGASETVLADWFVEERKIPLAGAAVKGTDSGGFSFEAKRAAVRALTVGGTRREVGQLYVVPVPPPFRQLGIAGIFGPQEFFKGEAFTLDFPNKRLERGLRSGSGGRVLALTPCSEKQSNKYLVEAELNGIAGRFYIDTGGRSAAITPQFAKKLGTLATTSATRAGVGSTRVVQRIGSAELRLGGVVASVPVDIETKGVSCPTADGKLGNDFLKDYALGFSADRKTLTLL
ncbi:MAG TPA: pepsin/retropepsin-like aspartic protease family protein [Bdellovibrionales bacterium]|nr:pepsin/retropepsin-like aspartic protease family protein [Bdellovibrionales bacterium]